MFYKNIIFYNLFFYITSYQTTSYSLIFTNIQISSSIFFQSMLISIPAQYSHGGIAMWWKGVPKSLILITSSEVCERKSLTRNLSWGAYFFPRGRGIATLPVRGRGARPAYMNASIYRSILFWASVHVSLSVG